VGLVNLTPCYRLVRGSIPMTLHATKRIGSALPGLFVLLSGCSTVSTLESTTLSQGRTATEIVYSMVLDNLAMIQQEPNALPWHLKITQGGIGITDTATPSFTFTWPTIARTAEISASRQWAVSWTVVPVQDKQTLLDLRLRYQREVSDDFLKYYEVASAPPSDRYTLYGRYRDTYVWVRQGEMEHVGVLVADILDKAPVTAADRAIQLPGPQTSR